MVHFFQNGWGSDSRYERWIQDSGFGVKGQGLTSVPRALSRARCNVFGNLGCRAEGGVH